MAAASRSTQSHWHGKKACKFIRVFTVPTEFLATEPEKLVFELDESAFTRRFVMPRSQFKLSQKHAHCSRHFARQATTSPSTSNSKFHFGTPFVLAVALVSPKSRQQFPWPSAQCDYVSAVPKSSYYKKNSGSPQPRGHTSATRALLRRHSAYRAQGACYRKTENAAQSEPVEPYATAMTDRRTACAPSIASAFIMS